MKRPVFSSRFSSLISSYLDYKGRNGFNEESYYLGLKKFDRFLCAINKADETFTKEDAQQWMECSDTESESAHYRRLEISREFLLYLHRTEKDVFVFRKPKVPPYNFIPHIYTEDEIARYFEAVDTYPFRGWKDRLQMPVLCRLLYTCGTRLGETLQIRKHDVDLEKGIIKLVHTKNNKPRYIVMSDSMADLMRQYADKYFFQIGDNDYIFSNKDRRLLTEDKYRRKHVAILLAAGIPYSGEHAGPRVHDWRHTFTVNSILQMEKEGRDVRSEIFYLIKYLGHESIRETERYVHMLDKITSSVQEGFSSLVDCLFGKEEIENEE